MGLIVRERTEGYSVDLMHFHGPNVASCEIVFIRHNTLLNVVYLTLSTIEHLPDIEDSLNRFPGKDSIIIGYLNAYTSRLQNP